MAHVRKRIESIRNFVNTQAALAKQVSPTTKVEYGPIRCQFNTEVILAIIGAELRETSEGTFKLKGIKSLPSKTEMVEINGLIDRFLKEVECVYLPDVAEENDMAILPPGNPLYNVNDLDKVTGKTFVEELVKSFTKYLTFADFMIIAAMAERLRKRNFIIFGIILGGIVVTAVGGYFLFQYVSGNEEATEEEEATDNEIDDIDVNELPNVEDDDMPQASIEDDIPDTPIEE